MYESEHSTRLIQLANRLQHEMANSYNPNRNAISEICQQIESSAHEIYKWVHGIEREEEHG